MKSALKDNWLVCRVCLKHPKETMQKIFDTNEEKDLTQMLSECGGIPIKKFDHYPDKICGKCYKYLRVAYKFRMTCQRSYNHLSRFIAPVDVETSELPPEITLEIETPNDMHMKLEPEENAGIKQESCDGEAEGDLCDEDNGVVDIYEPMDDDDIENAIEELEEFERTTSRQIEGMEGELNSADSDYADLSTPNFDEEEEFIDDFVPDSSTSDEEFIPKLHNLPKRSMKSAKKPIVVKATGQRGRPPTRDKTKKDKPRGKRGPKPKKETSYICDICGNIYTTQSRLNEHIKLHKGIKPHECEICGYAFAQTQQLARHMNTHTGNRPYKCQYCPAAFADLSTRNKHHRIHTNERPYVCDVCGKAFTYTNTLKFHKMIHTGEKPHVCDICGKGFQQAYKMRNHREIHLKKEIKYEVEDITQIETSHLLEI